MLARVMHHQRRTPRAHHRRHFAQDPVRRLVQPDRVAEDLADRVDQIDFLVPPRQLGRDLAGLLLGLHHRPNDLGELDGALFPFALYFEPGVMDGGDRLEPRGTVGSVEPAATIGGRSPARLFPAFAQASDHG